MPEIKDLHPARKQVLKDFAMQHQDLIIALLLEGFSWSAEGSNAEYDDKQTRKSIENDGLHAVQRELNK